MVIEDGLDLFDAIKIDAAFRQCVDGGAGGDECGGAAFIAGFQPEEGEQQLIGGEAHGPGGIEWFFLQGG